MIECIDAGLSTTNGIFPTNGCEVSELVKGTNPLGGQFKLYMDSNVVLTQSMSVSWMDHIMQQFQNLLKVAIIIIHHFD